MTPHVVLANAHESMDSLATKLLDCRISAAPVIDESGRLVGIISANDFLRRDVESEDHPLQYSEKGGAWEIQRNCPDTARSHMTGTIQTVSPTASLAEAAKIMTTLHIHHLPVLDDHDHVAGMLSAIDIVAAVLNVIEEQDVQQNAQHDAQ
jgi:CBS domain-containing membrane protein